MLARAGYGTCNENITPGTFRVRICGVMGAGFDWPTIAVIASPPVLFPIAGLTVNRLWTRVVAGGLLLADLGLSL